MVFCSVVSSSHRRPLGLGTLRPILRPAEVSMINDSRHYLYFVNLGGSRTRSKKVQRAEHFAHWSCSRGKERNAVPGLGRARY